MSAQTGDPPGAKVRDHPLTVSHRRILDPTGPDGVTGRIPLLRKRGEAQLENAARQRRRIDARPRLHSNLVVPDRARFEFPGTEGPAEFGAGRLQSQHRYTHTIARKQFFRLTDINLPQAPTLRQPRLQQSQGLLAQMAGAGAERW